MKRRFHLLIYILASLSFLVLIVDARTALVGAKEGIRICLDVLIPSLFPFLVLSAILNNLLIGRKTKIMHAILKHCGVPEGAETIVISGLLGGYPVGAKSVYDAYCNGHISKIESENMLAFCNNCGPAFIFGMLSLLFDNPLIPWIIWLIHIASALLVGSMVSKKPADRHIDYRKQPSNMIQIIENSVKSISVICTWVILFRIFLTFIEKWFLWILPSGLQIALTGAIELSNGCIRLNAIFDPVQRFIIASGIISFGGLCVLMQTISITSSLSSTKYFLGKLLQTIISILIAGVVQFIIFDQQKIGNWIVWSLLLISFVFAFYLRKKFTAKNSSIYIINSV